MKRGGIEKSDFNCAKLNRRWSFRHIMHMYRYLKSVFMAVKQIGSVPSNPNFTLPISLVWEMVSQPCFPVFCFCPKMRNELGLVAQPNSCAAAFALGTHGGAALWVHIRNAPATSDSSHKQWMRSLPHQSCTPPVHLWSALLKSASPSPLRTCWGANSGVNWPEVSDAIAQRKLLPTLLFLQNKDRNWNAVRHATIKHTPNSSVFGSPKYPMLRWD